jgi:hypothetical protein
VSEDYHVRNEDFERRGWRSGSDYYGNDQERYEGGDYDTSAIGAVRRYGSSERVGRGGEQDDWRGLRSAKAQGGFGGTRDQDFRRGDFGRGQSYNDRWQDSYRGSSRGATSYHGQQRLEPASSRERRQAASANGAAQHGREM